MREFGFVWLVSVVPKADDHRQWKLFKGLFSHTRVALDGGGAGVIFWLVASLKSCGKLRSTREFPAAREPSVM